VCNNDYIRIANKMREAVKKGQSFSLPLMRISDFSKVISLLKG